MSVTREQLIKLEAQRIQSDVKKLTKLLITKYDPKNEYHELLVAHCSSYTRAIEKLARSLCYSMNADYLAELSEQLTKCFVEFSDVMGVDAGWIEKQYAEFVLR